MRLFSFEKITPVLLIWLFFALALNSLIVDSPVIDEQNHLTRGYSFLTTGDPRLNIEHPPLINLLSAIPLKLIDGINFSDQHAGWQNREWYSVSNSFFWQDGNPVSLMVFLGRLPIVFLTIFLALTGLRFGDRLWGKPAGLIAFTALLFDPTIFAHGRYITTDLGGTLFIFLATFAIYNLFQKDEKWPVKSILLTAVAIGLAFSAKLTALVFIPIWIVLALLPLYKNGSKIGRRLSHLATAGVMSLFVLWAAFGFEWANFTFVDPSLLWLNGYSGPMPTFWSGVERITLLSADGGRPSFLLGNYSTDGFLRYFPVAFLAKTPLLTLIGFFGSAVYLFTKPATHKTAVWLLIPPILYFASTLTSTLNIGYRHLMPMLPFVYLLVVGGLRQLLVVTGQWLERSPLTTNHYLLTTIPLILFILPTLLIHPHQISFFNQAFGGPNNGRHVLADSNIDWGQDLQRLKFWMDENGVETVNLGWFGTADPVIYGLNHTKLPGEPITAFWEMWWNLPFDPQNPAPGIYALSVTAMHEMPHQAVENKVTYAYFRNLEPVDQIGYSILIYEVK